MLSAEGSALADLVLRRHGLLCHAVELDVHLDVLAQLESSPLACADDTECAIDRELFRDLRHTTEMERRQVPGHVVMLDLHIRSAWDRLGQVTPGQRM